MKLEKKINIIKAHHSFGNDIKRNNFSASRDVNRIYVEDLGQVMALYIKNKSYSAKLLERQKNF